MAGRHPGTRRVETGGGGGRGDEARGTEPRLGRRGRGGGRKRRWTTAVTPSRPSYRQAAAPRSPTGCGRATGGGKGGEAGGCGRGVRREEGEGRRRLCPHCTGRARGDGRRLPPQPRVTHGMRDVLNEEGRLAGRQQQRRRLPGRSDPVRSPPRESSTSGEGERRQEGRGKRWSVRQQWGIRYGHTRPVRSGTPRDAAKSVRGAPVSAAADAAGGGSGGAPPRSRT